MQKEKQLFYFNDKQLNFGLLDFWKWAYSDFTNNISRSVLAEFIVASALNISDRARVMWSPCDLIYQNLRIEVKSAAYIQSWEAKHPDRISFRIAPSRLPDETGDYKDNAPLQRNSDIYVFCIYTAMSPDESPFNLDLWDFFILKTCILDRDKPNQKTITLPSLIRLSPTKCNYSELKNKIEALL